MRKVEYEERLMKTPINPLHQRLIERANQTQPKQNTNEWDLGDVLQELLGFLAPNKYTNDFKKQWVCSYKNVIQTAAREFNIPEKLLAAIAWREVGGDPHFVDPLFYNLRDIGLYPGSANQTSFGDLSIQVRTAAQVLGYNPNQLSEGETFRIIKSLQEPRQNIFIAAKYLSDLRDKYRPGKNPNELSERDLLALAGAYNAGARYPTLEDFWKPVDEKGGNYAGGYGRSAFNGLNQCECF